MSDRAFVDEEEILVLTTRQPMPRWLRLLLQALAILAGAALLAGAFIGWRYYSVQQRVKRDLAEFIAHEEELRALGGVNAAPDLIIPHAPDAWRYRYLSSIRARKGRPIPDLALEKVDYDGESARAYLRVDGVRQFRQYQLEQGAWRRAPLIATGWGEKQVLPLPEGLEIIYWDEDDAFARGLAEDLPRLLTVMQALGIAPAAEGHRLVIIPKEFGDLVHTGMRVTGVIINSPHVDLIPQEAGALTPEQELRLALARKLLSDARKAAPTTSQLPGAARIQDAIDEVMAWAWAVGGVSDAAVADWAAQLKGEWASPVTGLPPDLITKLQPNASDAAARLMMAYLLRKAGVDALIALNEAMTTADAWDEAYGQAVGKTALQVEEAARTWAQSPDAPPPDWPQTAVPAPPQRVIYLNAPSASARWVLARTPEGRAILLRLDDNAALTLADGSRLDFDCIAAGSTLRVSGDWLDQGLQLVAHDIVLERAELPPIVQAQPMSAQAWALVARTNASGAGATSLIELFPTGDENIVATTDQFPMAATLDAPPLLVWSQATRCGRDWVLAYDPNQGVTGAWLAPDSRMEALSALALDDGSLLLKLSDGRGAVQIVRTGPGYALTPVTEADLKKAYAQTPPNQRWAGIAADNASHERLIIIDRATGASRILYSSQNEDVFVIQMFGGDPDLVYFARRPVDKPQALWQIAAIPWDGSGTITHLFDTPATSVPDLTMARCADGGYLYSVKNAQEGGKGSQLRLHKGNDGDEPVLMTSGGQVIPLYCRGQ